MLPLLLFPLPAGWLCVSSGFILLGMRSCPGLFPQLCAMTLTGVKMATSFKDWVPVADFLMLFYLGFGMILDGFCVIPSSEELTGGAQREAVTPNEWRFAEWERSVPHVFPECLLILSWACSHLQWKGLSTQAPSILPSWHLLVWFILGHCKTNITKLIIMQGAALRAFRCPGQPCLEERCLCLLRASKSCQTL